MTLSRHADRGDSTQDQERVPLLQNGYAATMPRYNAVDGTDDDYQRPLVSKGSGQSSSRRRIGQSSSDLIVRIQAICPNIHCPSCISHLSNLVSTLNIDESSHTRIANVDTSLIDRSVNFDLVISNVGAISQPRALSKLLVCILSEIATILAEDGFPVDHLRSKLASATPSHRRHKDLNFVLDAPDLYRKQPSSPTAHSLPDDARVGANSDGAKPHSILGTFPASLGSTLRSAWSRSKAADQEFVRLQQERWRKHVQVCEACRAGVSHEHASLLSQSNGIDPSSGVKQCAADDADERVLATFSVAGMTCASCAQSITKAVQAETSILVHSIQVNVMSASATVITHPSAVDKVAETIDNAGFEVQLIKTEPVPRPRKHGNVGSDSQWVGKLSVQGMTCASCVQSITSALNSFSEETNAQNAIKILETSINLMGKSADVKLSSDSSEEIGKVEVEKRLRGIISEIEDIGFDAELLTVQQEQSNGAAHKRIGRIAEDGSLSRSVRVKVEGMFCQNCVTKVRDYFTDMQHEHSSDIEVDEDDLEAFNLSKPFLSFSYTSGPNSKIRLRDVLDDISQLDPSFDAHYSPPASLASRSAVLARKELRNLLLRLSIAALFAVPSLVISMIAPVLPPDQPLRRYLSKKAWRSLSAVWKGGRSWTDRFLRFGNMDVLVALGTLVAYTSSLAFLVMDAFRAPQGHPTFRMLSSSNKGKNGNSMQTEMGMTYFEVSVFLVFFILLGRALESISKKKTGDAVADLGKMKPSSAYLVLDPSNPAQSKTEVVDVDMLEIGDMVLVPYGSSPPLDSLFAGTPTGKEDAQGLLDESSLSGEARPVSKQAGDNVFAGTINVSPTAIFARVGVLPGSCMIDEILDVVQESAGKKASIAQLADKITGVFVPIIVYISLSVFLLWTVLLYSGVLSESWQARHVPHYGEPGARLLWALQFGISCLLVACPCGIGLAAPTSQLAGIGLASKHGILVNGGGEAFRAASAAARGSADLVVVFDKTGTITKGEAVKVTSHRFSTTFDQSFGASNDTKRLEDQTLLRLVDLVEQSSTHPYATAVRGFVAERLGQSNPAGAGTTLPKLVDVSEVAGKGIRATFEGRGSSFLLLIGNKRLMDEMEGAYSRMDSTIKAAEQDWWAAANSVLYVGYQSSSSPGEICLAVAISDVIRPEASWVIHHLKQRFGAEVWMVSGDNEATARGVASQVGIPVSQVVAGVLPVQKKEWVERLQLPPSQRDLEHPSAPRDRRSWWRPSQFKQRMVCFVGDGINDSPALSSASLGIALGSGSSIAHSSSDFILLRRHSPLLSLPLVLTLSNATYLKIWTNFAWAFVFNLCLIPIAAGALVEVGVGLGPALSGLAMAFSSTSVVLNSLTLRWWRPEKDVRKRIGESEQQE
ncbi:related to CCC2 - copper resistance-associated P-type ATPase [Ustilago trichophora]|uniref:Related to CCC2 - copper resistance-associated P-type ATPase n=1 Tax=Ustilago trichophora TaxID=86804 RepID=A0A5C3DZL4_9BASI|nr:related to CCC2 - copper resistance-associated P-type ATPase [Ustilago trichophora]